MRKERMIVFTIIIVLILIFGSFMVTIAKSKNDKKDLIAIFYYTPNNPYTNEIISFYDVSINPRGPIISWLWDFGDGNTSTEQNPTHSYTEHTPDYITVTLDIADGYGLSNDTFQHIVILNRNPIANFSYSPDNPTDIQTVNFTDLSNDTDGNITSWHWMFGDGNISTIQNPSHQYSDNGTFTVTLNVTDNDNATNETSQQISILNVGPTSNFNYTPSIPKVNETVQFNDTSTDADGNITSWIWDFGDDTNSTEQNPTHQYGDNGTYMVTLTVTDDDNATDDYEQNISVLNNPPVANFTYEPLHPTTQDMIYFNSTSYDLYGTIVNYTWDFGDNTTSTDQNSTHQYAYNGTYTVTLTVTDDDGYNDSKDKIINITRSEDVEPPSKVTGLTVTDAKDGKLNLTWNASTDNVAVDYYNVYHDGPAPSPIVVDNSTITYTHIGLTNEQEYTYNVSAVDTSGNEGEKSDSNGGTPTATDNGGESPSSGGSHSSGVSPPSPPTNQNPIANASLGEPYQGYVNEEITFNGSLSNDTDGNINSWNWKFGDGTNVSGEVVNHTYSSVGTFDVVLTVIDDDGATDSYETIAVISHPNMPPTSPEVSGPTEGNVNIEYDYTFVSTDDDNDTIKYSVDWGDGAVSESGFLPNGTAFKIAHSWTSAGKYTINITADDNQTSTSTEMVVMIDAIDTEDIGYVLPIFDTIIVLGALLFLLLSKMFWKEKKHIHKKN